MNRRLAAFSVLGALLFGLMMLRTDSADALPGYLTSFNSQYGTAGSRLDTCLLCHNSATGGSRNAYGAAYAANGHSFTAIERVDSDGDGVLNIDEINARTFPGDGSDAPTPTPTTAPPTTTTPTTAPPTTTTPTTAPPTPTTPTTAPPTADAPPAAPAPADTVTFPMVIDAGDAGTVTIDLVDGKLTATVEPADGWTFTVETEDGDEIEVTLKNGATEVEVEAEYEDGNLEVKIETESDDDSDHDSDDDSDHDSDDDSDHDSDDDHDKARGSGHDDDDHGSGHDDDDHGSGHDDDDHDDD